VCVGLAVGIAILMLPAWSDTKWFKSSVMENLTEMAGGPIQMETLKLHLFPSPAIYVGNVSFTADQPNDVSFRANQVEMAIGWRSLWERKLVVSQTLIDQPMLSIRVPLVTRSEEPITWEFPAIEEMTIRNGQLHLLQVSENEEPLTLDWEAIHVTISELSSEGPSEIRLSALIADPQPSSTLTLTGTMSLLTKNGTPPQEVELSGFPGVDIQGAIEVTHFHLGRLVEFLRGHTLEAPIHTQANFQGNFSYTFQKDHDLLNFQSFQIALDEWSFAGQGHIVNVLHESPGLRVSGSTQPVAIERLPVLVPHDWMPPEFQSFLKDHQVAGNIELQKGSFGGPLDGNGSWDTQGIISLEGGQFLPAVGQPLLTNISGTVAFSPSSIQASDVLGNITPLTITTPETTVKFKDETVKLSVPTFQISEGNWNLNGTAGFTSRPNEPPTLIVSGSALPISIQHLSQIIHETWLPASVRTILTEQAIDGEMELLTGSVKWRGDEANTVISEGVIRLAKGHILVDPNHPPLTDLSGGIVFESNLVRLVDVEATISASKMSVKDATLEWKDPDLWVDLQGKGLFSAHDVYQALLRDPRSASLLDLLSQYHDAQGNLRISTRVQGPLTNPSRLHILQGKLLLADIHLSPTSNGLPIRQLNGQLSFDDQGIGIQRFNGQLGESPVDIKGQWSFRKDSLSSNVTIASRLSSSDLKTMFPSINENFSTLDGPIDTSMTFSGSALRPAYQARFDLTNTAITAKGLFDKSLGIPAVFEAKGSIQKNKAIRMTQGTLSIPPYTLEAQGQLSWSDPTSIRGFFQTESGTGSMFPPGVIIGDGRLSLSSLGMTWGLEGKSWDWTTWSMKGKIEGSNRSAESTTSNAKEEIQSASFQWVQKNQKGKGELTLKGIPLESLLASRSESPPPLTGTTSLKTSLRMNLESPEQMQRSLTGTGNAQIQKGLIQTGPVLSKILGILNVPSLLMGKVNLLEEGLPFDELTGSFSIDNGLLTTKDLALKSPVLKLTAAGTYDLPTENFESMIAVSPFGAYSNLLKDIPLFGSLMKGERKGFLTALFEVKGPRTKPEVTYLPMESLTGGLKGFAQFPIDVLKNIITLPIPNKETTEQTTPIK